MPESRRRRRPLAATARSSTCAAVGGSGERIGAPSVVAKATLSSAGLGGARGQVLGRNRLHRVSSCPRPSPRDRRRTTALRERARSSSRRTRPLARRSSPSRRRRASCFPTPSSNELALRGSSPRRGVCRSEASSGQFRRALALCMTSPRNRRSVLLTSRRRLVSSIGRWCAGSASATRATRRDHRPVGST